MKRAVCYSLIGLAMALSGAQAYADDTASTTAKSHHHGPHQPPQEAFTACANHNENDACSVTTPRGDVLDGTCVPAPAMTPAMNSAASSSTATRSSALACRPIHMPPPPQEGDAPEGDDPAVDGSEGQ